MDQPADFLCESVINKNPVEYELPHSGEHERPPRSTGSPANERVGRLASRLACSRFRSMVLKPQTLRNWKLLTGVASAATVFHTVFRVDYGPHDHCFTGIQRWYNDRMDSLLGIGPDQAQGRGTGVEEEMGRDRQTGDRAVK